LVHLYYIAVVRHALIDLEVKRSGQGHTVTKTITVIRLLVTHAAAAVAGVCLHVDATACVVF